jgi:succinyl-diaminopimelate desuccinylase
VSASSLTQWIDERSEAMAALLVRLVAIPSENPPGRSLRACARALAEAGVEWFFQA